MKNEYTKNELQTNKNNLIGERKYYNDLLKYMEIVLDMEKNVYIELKSWQDLQGKIKRLGIANTY